MNLKKPKQLILESLWEEKLLLEGLLRKLSEQEQAVESRNEELVLEIIEKKNNAIEKFKEFEREIEVQSQVLSPSEMKDVAQEGNLLKESLKSLLETIIRREKECEKQISLNMQEIEQKILMLQKGKKIGEGYGRYPRISPLISKKV